MKKTNWINFLHFYLPPTSDPEIIHEAASRSYDWIAEMAVKYSDFRFTFNMNACLTEMLIQNGYKKLLSTFEKLIKKNQLEIVDSLAYHPIAPLISENEVIEQIKENQKINRRVFGKKAHGFFLPEMAYSPKIGKLISSLGYKWLILDEISHNGKLNQVDWQNKYTLKNTDLNIVYRSRFWSKEYVPRLIINKSDNLPKNIITATDGELYGHRFVDWEGWLVKIIKNKNINFLTVSEYLKNIKNTTTTSPISSNWESLEKELKNNRAFGLWINKKNNIQNKLWELASTSIEHVKNNSSDENIFWAKRHLRRGLASCTFWWASGRDFRLFGPPAWKPDEVEKGINELIKAIRTLKISSTKKIEAEKLYTQIKKALWTKHWQVYDKK